MSTLLKGERQASAVRRFLGIDHQGHYPERSEFPESFVLAGEISNKIREITRDTMRDKKHRERELWIGVKDASYVFSPVYVGTDNEITNVHRNLFPNVDWDFPLMEAHTHGSKADHVISSVSAEDIASLHQLPHVPALAVSHDGGLWLLAKTADYYAKERPLRLEDIDQRREEIVKILREFEAKNLETEVLFLSVVARKLDLALYTFLPSFPKKSIIDFDNEEIILTLVQKEL